MLTKDVGLWNQCHLGFIFPFYFSVLWCPCGPLRAWVVLVKHSSLASPVLWRIKERSMYRCAKTREDAMAPWGSLNGQKWMVEKLGAEVWRERWLPREHKLPWDPQTYLIVMWAEFALAPTIMQVEVHVVLRCLRFWRGSLDISLLGNSGILELLVFLRFSSMMVIF